MFVRYILASVGLNYFSYNIWGVFLMMIVRIRVLGHHQIRAFAIVSIFYVIIAQVNSNMDK